MSDRHRQCVAWETKLCSASEILISDAAASACGSRIPERRIEPVSQSSEVRSCSVHTDLRIAHQGRGKFDADFDTWDRKDERMHTMMMAIAELMAVDFISVTNCNSSLLGGDVIKKRSDRCLNFAPSSATTDHIVVWRPDQTECPSH